MKNKILLTFDLEEFDLPEEYHITIDKKSQIEITTVGLEKLLALLTKHNIQSTFFTTAYYAENRPDLIKQITDAGHEIASHLYYHSDYNEDDLLKSKLKIEEISNQKVFGFRSPRLRKFSSSTIKKAGYLYDSSLNPTFIPGRYNHFNKPKYLHTDKQSDLLILPMSVALFMRFPLFWLSFKNMNFKVYLYLCKQTLRTSGVLHLYFHPWEFSDLTSFAIPNYIKKISGDALLNRLEKLISAMESKGDFITIINYIQTETGHVK